MLHYSCDLCGKELAPGTDRRYVVKLEVFAAQEPAELTEDDLDADRMEELSQILREIEENGYAADELPPNYKQLRYDLCPDCHKKFLRDPLGKEHKFDFSEN